MCYLDFINKDYKIYPTRKRPPPEKNLRKFLDLDSKIRQIFCFPYPRMYRKLGFSYLKNKSRYSYDY